MFSLSGLVSPGWGVNNQQSLDPAGERCVENREHARGCDVEQRKARMVSRLDEGKGAGGVDRVHGCPGSHDDRCRPSPENRCFEKVSRAENPCVDRDLTIGRFTGEGRECPVWTCQQRHTHKGARADQCHGVTIVGAHVWSIVRRATRGSCPAPVASVRAQPARQRGGAEAGEDLPAVHREPGHRVLGVGVVVKRAVSALIVILIARLSDV
jgi:hypothetical protein